MYKFSCIFFVAILAVQVSFSQHVSDYQLYHNEGRQLLEKGNPKLAVASFDKAIAKMPYYSEIYYDRGIANLELGNYHGAVADFSRALAKAPHKYLVLYERAQAFYGLKNYHAASADLITLLDKDPDHQGALALLNDTNHLAAQYEAELAAMHPVVPTVQTNQRPFPWEVVVPAALVAASIIWWR